MVTALGIFIAIVAGFVIFLFMLIPLAVFLRQAEDRETEAQVERIMVELKRDDTDKVRFVLGIMDELHIPHANGDDICISCGNPNCPYVLAERPYLACACWQPKGE